MNTQQTAINDKQEDQRINEIDVVAFKLQAARMEMTNEYVSYFLKKLRDEGVTWYELLNALTFALEEQNAPIAYTKTFNELYSLTHKV